MRRRGRSLLAMMLVGAVGMAWWAWRSKKVRERVREYAKELARKSDAVRELVRRTFRPQIAGESGEGNKVVITGLAAPEARPLTTVDDFLRFDPTADPDAPFCQTYNAPLLLPPAPPAAAATPTTPTAAAGGSTSSNAGAATAAVATAGSGASATGASATSASATSASAASAAGGSAVGRPRLMVCHDMMGGYLQDRLVQGGADPSFFRLWQWDQVDVFIYFSHHMVSLPPPGWTAAAHRNGVRVLGTFITEWDEGRRRCEALFASPASARAAADQLVALASHHGFEGWLVNIENTLPRELVPNLNHFVAHLRARMAAEVGPHAMVVWYDAMTTEGRLAWQDGLTRLNAPFFDSADALFVNYRWSEAAPPVVAEAAGSRVAEVFMGVDVFGRGSYGGGKDNCPVALAAARSVGLSAALFAPGWVFEEFDRATFEPRQEAFWAAIRAVWPPRPALLQRLPLATCFNSGVGRALWLDGHRVSAAPWFNMSAQDVVAATTALPSSSGAALSAATAAAATTTTAAPAKPPPSKPAAPASTVTPPSSIAPLTVRTTTQLSLCGGACLALSAPPPPPPSLSSAGPWVALHTLFTAALPLPAAGLDLGFTAACSGSSRLAVLLRTAPPEVAGGVSTVVGVAVGAWSPADRAVVEALRKAGYTCIACPSIPTGATTSPLPDAPTAGIPTAAAAVTPSAAATAAAAVPSGLPWVACSAHLPRSLIPVGSSAASAAAIGASTGTITAVGIACYHGLPSAAVAGAAATGPGSGGAKAAAGSAGGKAAARGTTAAGYGAAGVAASPYAAFLGRLALKEHHPSGSGPDPAAVTAAESPAAAATPAAVTSTTAAGPLTLLTASAPPPPPGPAPPLAGARCARVSWGRPTSAAARAASAAVGVGKLGDPRVSGELVDEGTDTHDDDDWERGSSGGGNGGGGLTGTGVESPVQLRMPTLADDGEEEEEEEEEEDGAAAGGDGDGEVEDARLLTCEIIWEPQFDQGGMPRHRSYHVWAHFNTAEAPVAGRGGGLAPLPGIASPTPAAAAAARGKLPPATAAALSAAAGEREGAWEVLHPDWSGAVWAGEAFVARYRLVQLEVPPWARSVTLLAQPLGADSGELGALQPLACVAVPPQ